MRLTIAAVGKLKAGPERELYQRYTKRVSQTGRALNIGPLAAIEIAESRNGSAGERCTGEAHALLAKIPGKAILIALDEKGDCLTSEQLARYLRQRQEEGAADIAFALGGPDGHGQALRERAARHISLGAITLPHTLARIVLAEQLYRAMTILAGHPYHRS
ncbi:MAG: 23S rRNA (pseudouridine(1915)-N(3))-methyltransferase RlmH [Methyloligellaceae bacterium]